MKQPRVPEYREADGVSRYIKTLILFLKDFSMAAWTANNQRKREIENVFSKMPAIEYPVTSVNSKTGDVVVLGSDPREDGEEGPELDAVPINADLLGGKTWEQLKEEVALPSGPSSGDLANWPVGSIYTSVVGKSPASLFGGTWEQLKDRFLLGSGDAYAAGSAGGEAEHELTVEEMPTHKHEVGFLHPNTGNTLNIIAFNSGSYGVSVNYSGAGSASYKVAIGNTGGGSKHNNLPPYLAVYMWKRVA